ncbi:hypothetical protein CPB84DRAFT_1771158, partial [Gymnopilus junonius]
TTLSTFRSIESSPNTTKLFAKRLNFCDCSCDCEQKKRDLRKTLERRLSGFSTRHVVLSLVRIQSSVHNAIATVLSPRFYKTDDSRTHACSSRKRKGAGTQKGPQQPVEQPEKKTPSSGESIATNTSLVLTPSLEASSTESPFPSNLPWPIVAEWAPLTELSSIARSFQNGPAMSSAGLFADLPPGGMLAAEQLSSIALGEDSDPVLHHTEHDVESQCTAETFACVSPPIGHDSFLASEATYEMYQTESFGTSNPAGPLTSEEASDGQDSIAPIDL